MGMPPTEDFVVLWGMSPRYPKPQFITAFSISLVDSMVEEHQERRHEAIVWFFGFDFDDAERETWKFWETVERIPPPTPPEDDYDNWV